MSELSVTRYLVTVTKYVAAIVVRACARWARWISWHANDMRHSPEWWLAWLWIRTKQMVRLLLSDLGALGVCATVFLGVFGLIVATSPVLQESARWAASDWPSVTWLLLGALLVSVLGMVLTAYLALRALGPSSYAQLAIHGRDLVEILTVLSIEVRYACRQFLEDTRPLHALLMRHLTTGSDEQVALVVALQKIGDHGVVLDRRLSHVQVALIRGRRNALRILSLKKAAAEQLSIPQRRLCDYLLEYSPLMHLELSQQYLEHCRRLVPYRDSSSVDVPPAQYPLTEQELVTAIKALELIARRFELCLEHHDAFLRHRDLFSFIHRIASQHSTSACVAGYAAALSYSAASAQKRFPQQHRAQNTPCDARILEALRILYRKQRVYPGADLHAACVRMVGRASGPADKRCEKTATAFAPLTHIGKTPERLTRVLAVVRSAGLGPPTIRQAKLVDCPLDWQNIGDLAYLSTLVTGVLNACQDRIAERFPGRVEQELGRIERAGEAVQTQAPRQVAIVTSGYSTTVKKCIMAAARAETFRLQYVLIVADAPDEDFDGFRMRDELRHSSAIDSSSVRVIHGDAGILFQSLRPDIERIVVLGAEIVARGADGTHRAIHPRNSMKWLPSAEQRGSMVIVAECYKRLETDLLAPDGIGRRQIGRLALVEDVQVLSCCAFGEGAAVDEARPTVDEK